MRNKSAGFTLLELVVAITLGGIILTTVMGTYLTMAKVRRTLDISRQIQREISFATMRISDRARAYSVNYDHFDEMNHHEIKLGDDLFSYDPDEKMLRMNDAPLFSPSLEVQQVRFTVFPLTPSSRFQSRVSIELEVTSKERPSLVVPLRTTISSRQVQ